MYETAESKIFAFRYCYLTDTHIRFPAQGEECYKLHKTNINLCRGKVVTH